MAAENSNSFFGVIVHEDHCNETGAELCLNRHGMSNILIFLKGIFAPFQTTQSCKSFILFHILKVLDSFGSFGDVKNIESKGTCYLRYLFCDVIK